eukprot:615657_1
MSTKRSRHTKHSKRKNQGATSPSIGANHHNFKHHRKLIPNLTFKTVPIVEIDVMDDARHLITTSNFIDKVSEYSKRPDVIDSGGFFIMRPKSTQKHRYLIDPQKIEHWNPQKHSDKHYFINEKQQNSHNHKPYNHKHWVYDIPQLSRTVDGLPLLVGSFPQRTCDVLTPLFTEQKVSHHPNDMPGLFHQHQKAHMNHKQDTSCSQTTNNRPSRKRKRHHRSASNHDTKRRKLHHHDHPIYKTPFTLPKALSIPKRDSLFDLSAYISTSDPLTIDVCSNRSDIASVDSFPTSNSSSFNDTVFISNHHNHNHNNSIDSSLCDADNSDNNASGPPPLESIVKEELKCKYTPRSYIERDCKNKSKQYEEPAEDVAKCGMHRHRKPITRKPWTKEETNLLHAIRSTHAASDWTTVHAEYNKHPTTTNKRTLVALQLRYSNCKNNRLNGGSNNAQNGDSNRKRKNHNSKTDVSSQPPRKRRRKR